MISTLKRLFEIDMNDLFKLQEELIKKQEERQLARIKAKAKFES